MSNLIEISIDGYITSQRFTNMVESIHSTRNFIHVCTSSVDQKYFEVMYNLIRRYVFYFTKLDITADTVQWFW